MTPEKYLASLKRSALFLWKILYMHLPNLIQVSQNFKELFVSEKSSSEIQDTDL